MKPVRPVHYHLVLKPDLKIFKFQGEVGIDFKSTEPVTNITLNTVDLNIISCELAIVQKEEKLEWKLNPKKQELNLSLQHEVIGNFRIVIHFEGSINNHMLGFYRSSFTTPNGKQSFVASTQFEEAEARKAFPCMDHPSFRSTFNIELIIPKEHSALSNMLPKEEIEVDAKLKQVIFDTTPPMPTYLLFFACGEFEILDSFQDHHLRGITTRGKLDFVKEGVEVGHASVAYCEKAFGTPYPLPKLDLIAVPDFAFGAMENWGAMTFRENLLLSYPEKTSRQDSHRIYEVIAHETVHQWFGDLVSPAGWNYLWLNESFATLFAFKALDSIRPEWKNMQQFIYSNNLYALYRDGLQETIPIELEKDSRITSSTAPIIYNKGGAVLNMLIEFLGEEITPALKGYFEAHSYGNAQSSDLWTSLFKVLPELPIESMMQSWITRSGYPILTVTQNNQTLIIRQNRFGYINKEMKGKWIIPLKIAIYHSDGSHKIEKHLMDQKELILKLPPDTMCIIINSGKTGFFRTFYTQTENLYYAMDSGILSEMDRFDIITDTFALVESGNYSVTKGIEFANTRLMHETAPLNLLVLIESLRKLRLLALNTSMESHITGILHSRLSDILSHFGLQPQKKESLSESQLREMIYLIGTEIHHPDVVNAVENFWTDKKTGKSLPSELSSAIIRCAISLHPELTKSELENLEHLESEQERINLVQALGRIQTKDQFNNILTAVIEKIPARIQYLTFASLSDNPVLLPQLWNLFEENLAKFEKLHPTHYERVLVQLINKAGIFEPEKMHNFIKNYDTTHIGDYGKVLPESLRMAGEFAEINIRLREKLINTSI